jgi:hypothetical protein
MKGTPVTVTYRHSMKGTPVTVTYRHNMKGTPVTVTYRHNMKDGNEVCLTSTHSSEPQG